MCRHCTPPLSLIFAGGANGSYVRSVSFCCDGRHVATACDDGYSIAVYAFLRLIFRSILRQSRPNKAGLKCPSVRAYVRLSTKSSFDFSEIWRVRRGR